MRQEPHLLIQREREPPASLAQTPSPATTMDPATAYEKTKRPQLFTSAAIRACGVAERAARAQRRAADHFLATLFLHGFGWQGQFLSLTRQSERKYTYQYTSESQTQEYS